VVHIYKQHQVGQRVAQQASQHKDIACLEVSHCYMNKLNYMWKATTASQSRKDKKEHHRTVMDMVFRCFLRVAAPFAALTAASHFLPRLPFETSQGTGKCMLLHDKSL
jgi:hypothetical protein